VPSQEGGSPSPRITAARVSAAAAVVLAIAAILALKPFSGGRKSHEMAGTTEATTVPAGGTSETTKSPQPVSSTQPVCHNELSIEGYASYTFDECKANREGTTGLFEVHEKTITATKVAEWKGDSPPSISDCIQSVGASGLESLKLKKIGEWLCAEGNERHVMLIRFDSYVPPENIRQGGRYKLFVDVYELGEG
jgi:hypothetical protein